VAKAGQKITGLAIGLIGLTLVLTAWADRSERVVLPRFPHDTEHRSQRILAVLYTPDDIAATSTLADLGYPDRKLFLLHREFPELKVTMQSIPASRYIRDAADRRVQNSRKNRRYPGLCCSRLWQAIAGGREEFAGWMELGNHGYSHAPPDDPDVDHHEFDAAQNPRAADYKFCRSRFELARAAYRALGIGDGQVLVMRFPGQDYTDAALRAVLDTGFIAFFGRDKRRYREKWVRLSDGREILNIPSGVRLKSYYQGRLGYRELDRMAEKGGLVNLWDHWWEMFRPRPGGGINYAAARDLLAYLKKRYPDRIWWPFGSQLALWLHFQRRASLTWREEGGSFFLEASLGGWRPEWPEIEISFTIKRQPMVLGVRYAGDQGRWQELPPAKYWRQDSTLYLNVPFRGRVRLAVES